MKMSTAVLTLLFLAGSAGAYTPSFDSAEIRKTGHEINVRYGPGKKYRADLSVFPKEYAECVQVSVCRGALEIDTRELFRKSGRGTVLMRFSGLSVRNLVREPSASTNRMSWYIEGTAGAPVELFYEGGDTGKDGKIKHYWRSKMGVCKGGPQVLTFDQVLPKGIRHLFGRIDLKGPGVFRIIRITCEPHDVKSKLDPKRNYLWNGGAERGLYGIFANGPEFALPNGTPAGWKPGILIDKKNFRSGHFSFCFPRDGGRERIYFNPVPFENGRSLCFRAWLKAEKKCRVTMAFFLANGAAYEKNVEVGENWSCHDLSIPVWGEKPNGVRRYGSLNPNSVYGAFGYVYPHFNLPKGITVWADDMSCHAGTLSGGFVPDHGFAVSGGLDRNSHLYHPGETLFATLEIRNPAKTEQKGTLCWTLTDYFGRIRSQGSDTVSVKSGALLKKEFTLPLPGDWIGPMNLRFEVNGTPVGFYLGVLPRKALPLNQRIGVNYSWGNYRRSAEFLSLFGIGAVRLWANDDRKPYRGYDAVEAFHKAGFYNMMCLSDHPEIDSFLPHDPTSWAEKVSEYAKRFRGQIDLYEILNEPNIRAGRRKNPDPAKYGEITPALQAKYIDVLRSAIKKNDPSAKIGGPGTCGTSPSWPVSVLAAGAGKNLDVITEHCYRDIPECPDYEPDIQSLFRAVRQYNSSWPIESSEAGYCIMSTFPDHQRIPDSAREQAEKALRLMLIGFANGVDKFYHFSFGFRSQGSAYNMTLMGTPANRFHPLPAPILFALRGAAERLGNKSKNIGRVRLGSDFRCYLFERGDARVAVLWKWNGKPERISPVFGADKPKIFDLFGNEIPSGTFSVGSAPCYLESTLPADAFKKQLAALPLARISVPASLQTAILDRNHFEVRVKNLTGSSFSGTVESNAEKQAFKDLNAESERVFRFRMDSPIGLKTQTRQISLAIPAFEFKQTRKIPLRGIFAAWTPKPIQIDGNLSDWPAKSEAIPLTVKTYLSKATQEDRNLTADCRFAWDDTRLYLAVTVNKSLYRESPTKSTGAMFASDSVQFAFDPLRNAEVSSSRYADDDFEYTIGRINRKTLVYRHAASSGSYDSLEKSLGITEEVQAAIVPQNGKTVYEMAFSRRALSPFRLEPGAAMRVNVLLNLGNAKGRAGFLELTDGIGSVPKRPGLFLDFILEKK